MNHKRKLFTTLALMALWTAGASAAIHVDTSPESGAPPSTLGGYNMLAFPNDGSANGTSLTSLTPPGGAPVTGNLTFGQAVTHYKVGEPEAWATWSHGYTGDVYYTGHDVNELNMFMPGGTLAFSLYLEPNIRAEFKFGADSEGTTTTITVNGEADARYVGFYSDDPKDSISFVFVKYIYQGGEDPGPDGFAVGEFMINGVVPEPATWLAGLLLLGVLGLSKSGLRKK